MRLVPRQLQRVGMTGTVPYYGGRLTPGQAYAASHPGQAAVTPPAVTPPAVTPPAVTPPAVTPPAVTPPAPTPLRPMRPTLSRDEQVAALQDLHDSGLLTDDEHTALLARVEP